VGSCTVHRAIKQQLLWVIKFKKKHCPYAFGIDLTSQLQRIGIRNVSIRCGDSNNDRILLSNVLHRHLPNLTLNIRRLIPNRHFGDARQINQSQIDDIR